ncbi:hypothetical protein WAI85_20345, partial [Acinetobacter baumannii]
RPTAAIAGHRRSIATQNQLPRRATASLDAAPNAPPAPALRPRALRPGYDCLFAAQSLRPHTQKLLMIGKVCR